MITEDQSSQVNFRDFTVEKSNERTRPHIVPVWVIWSQLLVRSSFHDVGPSWDLELARTFEM